MEIKWSYFDAKDIIYKKIKSYLDSINCESISTDYFLIIGRSYIQINSDNKLHYKNIQLNKIEGNKLRALIIENDDLEECADELINELNKLEIVKPYLRKLKFKNLID